MRYIILGNPVPLARTRTSYVHRTIYDSQKQQKLIAAIEVQRQHNDRPFYKGPLELDVIFYLPLAKSMSKKRMKEYEEKPHLFKPDTSNLIKFIEDAIQGVCYKSDAQIATIKAKKVFSSEPKTIFTIREL